MNNKTNKDFVYIFTLKMLKLISKNLAIQKISVPLRWITLLVIQKLKFLFIFLFIIFMNIYIGNLSYGVKEADLTRLMEDFGAVSSVKVIKDRDTGRSKGFAFCEMENDDEAKAAIEQLNGTEYSGRPLVVKEALPRN